MGRIGSEVRVSARFQIFALRMLLHSMKGGRLPPGRSFSGVIKGNVSRGISQHHKKAAGKHFISHVHV